MTALRVVLVCVSGAMICAVLRAQKPELALGAALATGVVALGFCMGEVRDTVSALVALSEEAGVSGESTGTLVRATGVALVAEFGAQLCRDAGESALAGRVELGGRVALISLTIPMLSGVTRSLMEILS